ncbi:hypothetical protein M758_11G054600 [Ceratodon purpureus]|nr:hypothetical protein M758_11G054600 [Ceratodon purpureus]
MDSKPASCKSIIDINSLITHTLTSALLQLAPRQHHINSGRVAAFTPKPANTYSALRLPTPMLPLPATKCHFPFSSSNLNHTPKRPTRVQRFTKVHKIEQSLPSTRPTRTLHIRSMQFPITEAINNTLPIPIYKSHPTLPPHETTNSKTPF